MIESLDARPEVNVADAELHRLLGYPRDHLPSDRARELSAWAREWFAEHGRPWIYFRETALELSTDTLRLDGVEFQSQHLREHLIQGEATRAIFVVASAGRECEEHARALWEQSKPDEYFFLEVFGSAVVEHLVATVSGRVCDLGARDNLIAIPHYSPGYTGWDVADQTKLFPLVTRGVTQPWPGQLDVLSSGMLRPKKSLLGLVGLTSRTSQALEATRATPCERCALSPCQYRRARYRHADASALSSPNSTQPASYTTNRRALAKWAKERVRLEPRDDGTLVARFRFDGTTCSNMGQPLAFDYSLTLGTAAEGFPIRESDCRPAADDEGHKKMCSYLADAPALMQAIATEKPLLGRPLGDVLNWTRTAAPSGCHCDAVSRAHKWGLALEAIHFALAQQNSPAAPRAASTPEPATTSP